MDEAGLESEQPATAQVASDASLAIVAGSDTISPGLCNLFWFLLCNPVVYGRLQAEIDEAKPSIEDVTTQAHLPYLNAVMYVRSYHQAISLMLNFYPRNETLRILPPVLSGSLRAPLVGKDGHRVGPQQV